MTHWRNRREAIDVSRLNARHPLLWLLAAELGALIFVASLFFAAVWHHPT